MTFPDKLREKYNILWLENRARVFKEWGTNRQNKLIMNNKTPSKCAIDRSFSSERIITHCSRVLFLRKGVAFPFGNSDFFSSSAPIIASLTRESSSNFQTLPSFARLCFHLLPNTISVYYQRKIEDLRMVAFGRKGIGKWQEGVGENRTKLYRHIGY